MESKGSKSHAYSGSSNQAGNTNDLPPEQNVIPKPLSFADKLRLMIIRIGDEKRNLLDDHIKKLKDVFLQDDTQKQHRERIIDTIVTCIVNLPHKSAIYASLVTLVSLDADQFAVDIINRVFEALKNAIVKNRDVPSSKNAMRFISFCVNYGCISSQVYSQLLIQILDECSTGAALKNHSLDLILETILCGLPIAAQKLNKEQGLDYGTILENIKKLITKREKNLQLISQVVSPMKESQDFISRYWDAFQSISCDSIRYDKLLLSISSSFDRELRSKCTAPKYKSLTHQISFVEHNLSGFNTWQSALRNEKMIDKVYYSLQIVEAFEVKAESFTQFELLTALDMVNSVMIAFSDSQQMASHNLWNLYINEDLREYLPMFIINTVLSHLLSPLPTHFSRPPVFYGSILISVINQTKESSLFKNFQGMVEEAMAKIAKNKENLNTQSYSNYIEALCFYVSQTDFKVDNLYAKLESLGVSEDFIRDFSLQLIRMSYFKKLQSTLDQKYHKYLPEDASMHNLNLEYATESGDNPDAKLIMDRLNSKETPTNLRQFLDDASQFESTGVKLKMILIECILSKSRKSLEHFKRYLEVYYNEVFKPFFLDDQDADKAQIGFASVIARVWQNNEKKALQLLEKGWQCGLLLPERLIDFAFQTLSSKDANEKIKQIAAKSIIMIADRVKEQPEYLVTLFNQAQVQVSAKKPTDQADQPMADETAAHNGPVATDLTLNKRKGLVAPDDYEKEFESMQKEQSRFYKHLLDKYIDVLEKNGEDKMIAESMLNVISRNKSQITVDYLNDIKSSTSPLLQNTLNVLQAL